MFLAIAFHALQFEFGKYFSVKTFFQRYMLANTVQRSNQSNANSPLLRAMTYKSFDSARLASSLALVGSDFYYLY